jgi:hypothetical protein
MVRLSPKDMRKMAGLRKGSVTRRFLWDQFKCLFRKFEPGYLKERGQEILKIRVIWKEEPMVKVKEEEDWTDKAPELKTIQVKRPRMRNLIIS